MARTIQSIPEMYTGTIASDGVTRDVNMRVRVVFQDGDPDGEWFVFGEDPAPTMPAGTVRQAIHFPAAIDVMQEGESLLYDLALQAMRGMLEA